LKSPGPRPPASTGRSAATVSRTFVSGRSKRMPFQRSTITSDDDPSPRTKRPPDASASAAACCASTAGPRVNAETMAVPSRMRPVQAAASASGVNPSGPFVSPVQKSSQPAASARRTSGSVAASGTPANGSMRPQRGASDTARTV
jgi:hypothetical protein